MSAVGGVWLRTEQMHEKDRVLQWTAQKKLNQTPKTNSSKTNSKTNSPKTNSFKKIEFIAWIIFWSFSKSKFDIYHAEFGIRRLAWTKRKSFNFNWAFTVNSIYKHKTGPIKSLNMFPGNFVLWSTDI